MSDQDERPAAEILAGMSYREAIELDGHKHAELVLRAEREANAERFHRNRIEASNLPAKLRAASFDGFSDRQRHAVEGVKRCAYVGDHGVCLTGGVGVGKSWLAAAGLMKICEQQACEWVPVASLMTRLRGNFDDDKAEAGRLVTSSGAIVLDDLDKANPTDYGREVLFSLIENRVSAGVPFIVTTNLRLSAIADRLGEPIASRLASLRVFDMNGPDRRLG